MSALTAGNWIAFQVPAQKRYNQWSVGIENQYGIHGVGSGELRDVSMFVGGICSEADAKAMAAAKELIEVAQIGMRYLEELIEHNGDDMGDTRKADLERIAAVLAKVGAS